MLERSKAAPPKWLTDLHEKLPVERVSTVTYINARAVKELALPLAGPQAGKVADVLDALGFSNLTAMESVTGLDQQAFAAKTLWAIDGELKGIFRLADVKPLTPDDLAIVPRDATFAAAFKLDPAALFDLISEITASVQPEGKAEFDRNVERMNRSLGLNLKEDVLAPLGDTWRVFDSPAEGGAISGMTAVVALKDPQRAAESLEKLMKLLQERIAR